MSDLNLLPEHKESVELLEKMVDSLPTAFPKAKDKNNYSVYGPIANQQRDMNMDIHRVKNAKLVQQAETIEELVELGKLVDTYPKTSESLEKYRLRVLTEYQSITNEASPTEIIENSAYVLNVHIDEVEYSEADTPGYIVVGVEKEAFDESSLSQQEITELLEKNIPAGYQLVSVIAGTLEFISEEDHNIENNYPETGYSGLDSNENPTGIGGTYSSKVTFN